MKVSAIIPIYNSEKYLGQCIESVVAQTLRDIEIILVDDGSTDKSLDICKEYAEKDSSIRVISKQNGGVSSARNRGIEEAKGEWVAFVDSDDYIEPEYLETLYEIVENGKGKDFVIQGYDVINAGNSIEEHHLQSTQYRLSQDIFDEADILEHGHVCGRLYYTPILKDNGIRFNANIKYAEDQVFMLQYLRYVDKVIYIEGSGYNYRMFGTGLSAKFGSFESNYTLFSEFMKTMKMLAKEKEFDVPYCANRCGAMYLFRAINALYTNKTPYSERMKLLKQIKAEQKSLIRQYYTPKIRQMKIGRNLFLLNLSLFDYYFMLKFKKYRQQP